MNTKKLLTLVQESLADTKAVDVISIDVQERCNFTDYMVICTGNSNRHINTMAEKIVAAAKKIDNPPLGVEGKEYAEWVLIDLGDVVVHLMQQSTRDFYALEKLWKPSKSPVASEKDQED